MAKSLILHTDKQGVTQLEKMMWDERRYRLCFAWSILKRRGGGGDPVVLWAGKKYNCKGWTLTPPDLASNPSEHSLTSNLQAPWLTQEIVAAALTASRRCSLQHRLSDIWWKSRNENTMESLTLGNHAVSTAGHHSPWIWVFRRQNDDKPTGNH